MALDQEDIDHESPRLDHSVMSFGDHLEELRFRLMMALVVPIPLMMVLFPFSDDLRNYLCQPVLLALESSGLPAQLQAMNPAETLTTDLKLSIIFALVLSCPWVFWQSWKFIEPGLYNQERRFVHLLIPGSALLTISGLALLHFVMLPLMLMVLISFGIPSNQPSYPTHTPAPITAPDAATTTAETGSTGNQLRVPISAERPQDLEPGSFWISPENNTLRIAVPAGDEDPTRVRILQVPLSIKGMVVQQYRLSEYINFILMLMIGIAIAFQMPLVILLLGWVGIVKPTTLRKNRKYALLVCAVVAAITTPADVISMFLMLIPLYFLYEFGILLLILAPANRVAEGAVFKGAVEDVLGRFDRDDEDDPDPEQPNDPPQDPDDGPDDDPPAEPDSRSDEPRPPFPTDSGGPPSDVIPVEGSVPARDEDADQDDENDQPRRRDEQPS
jgi:sec-independent protein translocase protein TatC